MPLLEKQLSVKRSTLKGAGKGLFTRKHVIDAWARKSALARYANDARGLLKTTGLRNNSTYETEGLRVFIVAAKNIPAGAEIFVAYGKEYWDIIKENWKEKK